MFDSKLQVFQPPRKILLKIGQISCLSDIILFATCVWLCDLALYLSELQVFNAMKEIVQNLLIMYYIKKCFTIYIKILYSIACIIFYIIINSSSTLNLLTVK